MTRRVVIDLDELDADHAVFLYNAARYRIADPSLREAIQRRAAQTGDEDLIAMIENALDRSYPADVLRAFWRQIIPNEPTIGYYLPRAGRAAA